MHIGAQQQICRYQASPTHPGLAHRFCPLYLPGLALRTVDTLIGMPLEGSAHPPRSGKLMADFTRSFACLMRARFSDIYAGIRGMNSTCLWLATKLAAAWGLK